MVVDSDQERRMIEQALRDHQRIVKLLQHRRSQLEHGLKFWQDEPQKEKTSSQATVDALVMLSDTSCAFDLLSATFAKGLRVNDLTVTQLI